MRQKLPKGYLAFWLDVKMKLRVLYKGGLC